MPSVAAIRAVSIAREPARLPSPRCSARYPEADCRFQVGFAREVGHRVIFMDDGLIVEEGQPRELFANPQMDRTKNFLAKIL